MSNLSLMQARLEVDLASSSGAVVFAYAYLTRQSRHSAILLQDLIWRRHNGPIPERKRVVHRNHISMDNRLDNLCLIDIRNAHVWYTRTNAVKSTSSSSLSNSPSNDKATANDLHLTLYWAAIQQLPPEQQSVSNSTASNGSTSNTASQANEVSSRRPAIRLLSFTCLPVAGPLHLNFLPGQSRRIDVKPFEQPSSPPF